SIGVPAFSPSIVQPTKGPWLVPKIVVRYREPKAFIRPPPGERPAPACRPRTTDRKPGSTTGPKCPAGRPPRGRPPRRPSSSGGLPAHRRTPHGDDPDRGRCTHLRWAPHGPPLRGASRRSPRCDRSPSGEGVPRAQIGSRHAPATRGRP